jgi:hypothetical protein
LGFKVNEKEAALTIWEVDDDNDGVIDWDEFRMTYYRVRSDDTGCEPRKLFNLVDFLMLDKNHSGSVDMDECVTLLYTRYGKDQVETNLRAMKQENHPSVRRAHGGGTREPRQQCGGRLVLLRRSRCARSAEPNILSPHEVAARARS